MTAVKRPAADTNWVFHADHTAVFDALANGKHAESLREYFGTAAYAELRVLAAAAARHKPRARGPRVLILPGIMGSRLGTPTAKAPDVLWIDPLQIAAGCLKTLILSAEKLVADHPVAPMGVLLFSYAKLKLKLQLEGCAADFFAYDWRLGIDELGAALARQIVAEGAPVHLIAHSMGGLIARVAARRLPKRFLRKLIMLGTPNEGSFAPVQALRGTYPFVRQISSLDRTHSADELATEVFNTFPGIYHLLPPRRGGEKIDLLDPRAWPSSGAVPRPQLLAQVKTARAQLAPADARMTHIIGVNQETVVRVRRTAKGFEYGSSVNGDGTVPLARAQMKQLKAYFVEESHANLPSNSQVIQAIIDLLQHGRTGELTRRWPPKRSKLNYTDDAALSRNYNDKIDWRQLTSAQREAALGELDGGRLHPYQV